jgi:DnaJ-class molecular chaperone
MPPLPRALLALALLSASAPAAPALRRLRPIKARFAVPLADFIRGRTYAFVYTRRVRCACPGAGGTLMCAECGGYASVLQSLPLTVALARGAEDPKRFVIENVTDSSGSFDAGNLEITIEAQPHPVFARRKHDIEGTVKLTPQEAERGARDVVLPTGERRRVTFEPGQASVRLPGLGVPHEGADRVGDLVIRFA